MSARGYPVGLWVQMVGGLLVIFALITVGSYRNHPLAFWMTVVALALSLGGQVMRNRAERRRTPNEDSADAPGL